VRPKLIDVKYLERLLRETERTLIEHWNQIEAVAAALLEREFLSASEIYQIIVRSR
jgi:hypothetical protein